MNVTFDLAALVAGSGSGEGLAPWTGAQSGTVAVTGVGRAIIEASAPEFLGGVGVALVVAVVTWLVRRRRTGVRRYVLLNSVDSDGNPVSHVTTCRGGTVIRRDVGRGPERFELTDMQLPDGAYVAEPLDRYV
ncbi:hypothetical protein [Streptomyces sp. NPDC057052]|uniref:hypothetical protein n=1 Tax=Streptomyces sp. NPDC057052 TaxID=3346010 RepID=UPI003636B99B